MSFEVQIIKTGREDGKKPEKPVQITKFRHIIPISRQISDAPQEHLLVVSMDIDHFVLATRVVHIGVDKSCPVSAKDILRGPINDNAEYIIIVHNHPDGYFLPSKTDKKTMKRLAKTAMRLDIGVIDCCIVTKELVYSMNKGKRVMLSGEKV